MEVSLVLVGCGKMGGALLDGWLNHGVDGSRVTIVDPVMRVDDARQKHPGIVLLKDVSSIGESDQPDVVVMAIKPQMIQDVVPEYRRFSGPGTVFLSIAAGTPVSLFEKHLGGGTPIVRAMPNLPASVHRGITVAWPNKNVTTSQRQTCHDLLAAVGEVAWIEDERLIDAVTAVSGSGPAYVFHLAECLAIAGVKAGLSQALADQLARSTVAGAGELLYQSREAPARLRQNVTSPGGTTAAALEILMAADGLQPLMTKAVDAAAKRSRKLAGYTKER